MNTISAPDLALLSDDRLLAMYQAGQEIFECYRVLRKAGLNIVGEVLRDTLNAGNTFYELEHYPPDDVYDAQTHAQYYYHSHRGEVGEHGHFHTFLRAAGMPVGSSPVNFATTDPWPQGDAAVSHLFAIAMDAHGYPTGLFTVNRWVTDETWYPGEHVIRMLDYFKIDHAFPSWPVNRWISAMAILFRPHIEALIHQRDQTIQHAFNRSPEKNIFEDRSLDVTSFMAISVDEFMTKLKCLMNARHLEFNR
ncbi:MAG: hypothetical protein RQ714_08320 [Nitrosomonas sp.]|nr:hypothetical protein [Nitrosomonas sp.]